MFQGAFLLDGLFDFLKFYLFTASLRTKRYALNAILGTIILVDGISIPIRDAGNATNKPLLITSGPINAKVKRASVHRLHHKPERPEPLKYGFRNVTTLFLNRFFSHVQPSLDVVLKRF
jgi:hypothetical protein